MRPSPTGAPGRLHYNQPPIHARAGAIVYNLPDHCLRTVEHSKLEAEVAELRAVLDAKVGLLKLLVCGSLRAP